MKTIISSFLAFMFLMSVTGSSAPGRKTNIKILLQGYSRDLYGGGFKYHSPSTIIDKALLVRANKYINKIEWESETVPAGYKGKTVSFVWFFGISCESINHKFHLSAGDNFKIDFLNERVSNTGEWTVAGSNNSRLTFNAVMSDQNSDLMGIATLELPADKVEKGKPLHFTVTGEDADSQEWYMTFQGQVKEEINLYQTDCVSKKEGREFQALTLNIFNPGEKEKLNVKMEGGEEINDSVQTGRNSFFLSIPRISANRKVTASIKIGNKPPVTKSTEVRPVREMTVYVLPHSHVDIGYTAVQTEIEEKQINNLKTAIEFARKTADYPEGSRFVWNAEVMWTADLFLSRMSEKDRSEFFEAVKKGQVSLNGMYLNELTGLCRPEELLRLFKYGADFAEKHGVKIDAAMTSDVPGQTWGTVAAMAQAGIKYFSTAPNNFDRIGNILVQWENKPFYWISPSGKEKVLVWIPYKGYALSHGHKGLSEPLVRDYIQDLKAADYPYDISYIRWSGHGDNAAPEIEVSEFVKDWNSKFIWPKFIISSTSEAFSVFEKKYGASLPQVKGDWTPYWEDGAGSSASETAVNRASSGRLSQAEAIWAMKNPGSYPAAEFEEAWKKVLLYSEHTWGAWQSVSDPENKATKEQWEIKQSYALSADRQSKNLLQKSLTGPHLAAGGVDVYNTTSWTRTELVTLTPELSKAGDMVTDVKGAPVPSQRLSDGSLAVLIKDIPPFSSVRLNVQKGSPHPEGNTIASGNVLDNGIIKIKVDEKTGALTEFGYKDSPGNFADAKSGGLNGFLYLPGDKISDIKTDSNVKVSVKERGPLVASLLIESDAPSCSSLKREIRLTSGMDRAELTNIIDKKRAEVSPRPGDGTFAQKGGKESLNFAFPFSVPGGRMSIDLPLGMMEPEKDQIPSACKNWITAGAWADVSNDNCGITLALPDAPLLEAGEISANLTGSQTNPDVWRKKIEPTQTLYSWVMNNHWGTNYRAYQEGVVAFRYGLRPHGAFSEADAYKFAAAFSEPLIACPAAGSGPSPSLFGVDSKNIAVNLLKPSDDGKGVIIGLYNCSRSREKASLVWGALKPKGLWISNTAEKKVLLANDNSFIMEPQETIIIRAEL